MNEQTGGDGFFVEPDAAQFGVVRKLSENRFKQAPAERRCAEVPHVLREDRVELVQEFVPAPMDRQGFVLERFANLTAQFGLERRPQFVTGLGEGQSHVDFVGDGFDEFRVFDGSFVTQFQIAHVEPVGEFDCTIDQSRGGFGCVGDDARRVEVGQADEEAAEEPAFDKSQRQDADELIACECLEADRRLLQSIVQNTLPLRPLIETDVAFIRKIAGLCCGRSCEFDLDVRGGRCTKDCRLRSVQDGCCASGCCVWIEV